MTWTFNPPGAEVSVLLPGADGKMYRLTWLSHEARAKRDDGVIAEVRLYTVRESAGGGC